MVQDFVPSTEVPTFGDPPKKGKKHIPAMTEEHEKPEKTKNTDLLGCPVGS